MTSYRDAKQNLRTQFERIIQRAGLKPWPELFQNLRSSRETGLAQNFPIQVVVAWLGNSEPVARKHYLQVTEDHFSRAISAPSKAKQNPPSQPAANRRNPRNPSQNQNASNDSRKPEQLQPESVQGNPSLARICQ